MALIEKSIDGKDVQVGHLWRMAPSSTRVHRIVRLDPYPGIEKLLGAGREARIARSDTGVSITVIHGDTFKITEEGGVQ